VSNTLRRAYLCCSIAVLVGASASAQTAQTPLGSVNVSAEPIEEALARYFAADSKTVAAGLLFVGAVRVGPALGLPEDDSPQSLGVVDRLANPAIRAPLTIETVDSVYDYILRFREIARFRYSREDRRVFKRLERILFKRRCAIFRLVDWITAQHPPRKPSGAYTLYFEFAQRVAEAKDRYNAAKADHEDVTKLADLQREVDCLESSWQSVGRKDEMDRAMAEYGILTAKNPTNIWSKIEAKYNEATLSVGNSKIPRTELSPKIAAWSDNGGWELVSVATSGGASQVRIKTIQIARPWLDERVFGSLSWSWIYSAPLGHDHVVADGGGLATVMTRSKTIGLMPRQLVIATYASDNTAWPRSGFLAGYLASVVAATPKR
jgi:hypothetical protein